MFLLHMFAEHFVMSHHNNKGGYVLSPGLFVKIFILLFSIEINNSLVLTKFMLACMQ